MRKQHARQGLGLWSRRKCKKTHIGPHWPRSSLTSHSSNTILRLPPHFGGAGHVLIASHHYRFHDEFQSSQQTQSGEFHVEEPISVQWLAVTSHSCWLEVIGLLAHTCTNKNVATRTSDSHSGTPVPLLSLITISPSSRFRLAYCHNYKKPGLRMFRSLL